MSWHEKLSPHHHPQGGARAEQKLLGRTVTRTLGCGQDERVQADSQGGQWLHERKGLQTTELET